MSVAAVQERQVGARGRRIIVMLVVLVAVGVAFAADRLAYGLYANQVFARSMIGPREIIWASFGLEPRDAEQRTPADRLPECFTTNVAAAPRFQSLDYTAAMFSCAADVAVQPAAQCQPVISSSHLKRAAPFLPAGSVDVIHVAGTEDEVQRAVVALTAAEDWDAATIGRTVPDALPTDPFFAAPSQSIDALTCNGYGIIKIERP